MTDEPETTDPFETELRSFRPAEPSAAVFDAVGRDLARDARSRRKWRPLAAGIAAIAACFIAAVVLWRVSDPYVDPTPPKAGSVATVPGDDERPALASYRRAMARSAAELDHLLDRHAARLLPNDPGAGERLTASDL